MLGPCCCCSLSYLFSVSGYYRTPSWSHQENCRRGQGQVGLWYFLSPKRREHICRPTFLSALHQLTGRQGETTGTAPFSSLHPETGLAACPAFQEQVAGVNLAFFLSHSSITSPSASAVHSRSKNFLGHARSSPLSLSSPLPPVQMTLPLNWNPQVYLEFVLSTEARALFLVHKSDHVSPAAPNHSMSSHCSWDKISLAHATKPRMVWPAQSHRVFQVLCHLSAFPSASSLGDALPQVFIRLPPLHLYVSPQTLPIDSEHSWTTLSEVSSSRLLFFNILLISSACPHNL